MILRDLDSCSLRSAIWLDFENFEMLVGWLGFFVLFSSGFLEREGEEQYRGSELPNLIERICVPSIIFVCLF